MKNVTTQEEKVMKNKVRFVKYLKKKGIVDSEEELERWIMIIPAKFRRVIEVRWGLNVENPCHTSYRILNKKLGVDNGEDLYKEAEEHLKCAKFVELLKDYEDFEWNMAVHIGRLVHAIIGEYACDISCVLGKNLLEVLPRLDPRQYRVLYLHFGLDGKKEKVRKEVGEEFKVSEQRIGQIEARALGELRQPLYKREYYIPLQEETKRDSEKWDIKCIDFSVRTLSALLRAGYKDLRELKTLSFEELLEIKNIGNKGAEEIQEKISILL